MSGTQVTKTSELFVVAQKWFLNLAQSHDIHCTSDKMLVQSHTTIQHTKELNASLFKN